MGKMYIKQQIVQENPELVLSENGDFIIDKSLVDKYEIIDVHCHLFKGLALCLSSRKCIKGARKSA